MKIVAGFAIVAVGIVVGAPACAQSGQELMKTSGCVACHDIDKKLIGPAYKDVAAKYKGDKTAAAKLAAKVKAGGQGVWGDVPMPPNVQVADADIKKLVAFVLALKK